MSDRDDISRILKQVEAWPAADRETLVRSLLEGLPREPRGPKPALSELVGVARGPVPAPSDEQVKQWIDEHRMRKYG